MTNHEFSKFSLECIFRRKKSKIWIIKTVKKYFGSIASRGNLGPIEILVVKKCKKIVIRQVLRILCTLLLCLFCFEIFGCFIFIIYCFGRFFKELVMFGRIFKLKILLRRFLKLFKVTPGRTFFRESFFGKIPKRISQIRDFFSFGHVRKY